MHRQPAHQPAAGRTQWYALAALLVGSLLLGVAQVAVLPPFEGADETAHYSYIQQVAETGTWPRLGGATSGEVDSYRALAPLPTSAGGPWTYQNFFESSADVIERARAHIHRARDPSPAWTPGRGENWEAQHPPLYYLLLSPLYLATKSWSLIHQLFALRLFSYLLAWGAMVLAIATALRAPRGEPHRQTALVLAPALWPALFPMWFPEMARLGNDSLVAALAALAWIALIRLHAGPARVRNYAVLGAIGGLGLLTKATMAPFVGVVGAYLVFLAWKRHGAGFAKTGPVCCLAAFFAAVILVAGWWYGLKLLETGNLLGSFDVTHLEAQGGLLKGLQEHGSVRNFALSLMTTVLTFLWGGTWSFVAPALALFAPFLLLLLLLLLGWLAELRRHHEPLDAVPAATLIVFFAGLARHTLVLLALVGSGVAPGWFFHSIMPILAPAVGLALAGATAMRALYWPAVAAIVYPTFFLIFAMAGQVLFYAGCGVQRPSLGDLVGRAPCGLDLAAIYDRLAVLAYPGPATFMFMAGWLALLCGAICACATLRSGARTRGYAFGGGAAAKG